MTKQQPTDLDEAKARGRAGSGRKLFLLAPFCLLCAFAALAFVRIDSLKTDGQNDEIPNALQGKLAPPLHIPLLPAAENSAAATRIFDSAALKGRVTLVNFWGSWCPPCREEHPFLMTLADNPAFQLVGINYKDSAENAVRFLGSFGNPFRQIGYDAKGRAAIDWGVYGPPETFVLSKSGIILYRFVGPMNAESFREKIWPVIARANAA